MPSNRCTQSSAGRTSRRPLNCKLVATQAGGRRSRSHGFGTQALEEFKNSKVRLKVDSNGNYDLSLAANEYMANGHTLDKHVGKTGEQLARLQACGRPERRSGPLRT